MRIAIYARYSSDLQNPSSVDDQVALCRRLISNQFGLNSDAISVYSDAAISGATMERPGILRLLQVAKTGQIDLVVAEGLDRLSRSLKDIATIFETLGYLDVGIWTSHEGKISALHVGMKGTMNALFLNDMKEKVRRGQSARIEAGYAASSCAYGYRVVRGTVDARGRSINGVREINEYQATVIQRIYSEYASGKKTADILAGLNSDGIPAPRGGLWKLTALLGSPKKRDGILRTEIYLGKLVFNKTRVVRNPATNKKRFIINPEVEWTKVDVPHLRIIPDDLWQAVRDRDHPRPQSSRLPRTRVLTTHNQHALTGWIKCGWCGGSKSIANNSRYLCSTHRYAKQCKNSRGTKEPVLMSAVFDQIYNRIKNGPCFRERFAEAFSKEVSRNKKLDQQAYEIELKIRRLMTAIEQGIDADRATQRIIELQRQIKVIEDRLQSAPPPNIPDNAEIRHALLRAVMRIQIENDIRKQRILFQYVLKGITLTPIAEERTGETIKIELREEGWPDFWRLISA